MKKISKKAFANKSQQVEEINLVLKEI